MDPREKAAATPEPDEPTVSQPSPGADPVADLAGPADLAAPEAGARDEPNGSDGPGGSDAPGGSNGPGGSSAPGGSSEPGASADPGGSDELATSDGRGASDDEPTEPFPAAPGRPPAARARTGQPAAAGPPVAARLGAALRQRRLSGAGAVIGVLLGLLGFALVVQLRSNATDPQLASARPEDLVRILSDLDARKDRLSQEITSLESTKQELTAGSAGRTAALDEARKRADELGILAGTLAAQGPGMTVRLVPGNQPLKAWLVLDTVEELRGAGAEAMQIAGQGGATVRVVASTYFTDSGAGLLVDGTTLVAPYTITVIGDPQTMAPALNIAGGVVDTVHNAGGTVIVDQSSDTVRVTATRSATTPKYAQPVG